MPPSVMLGLPCYKSMPPETALSLLALWDKNRAHIKDIVSQKFMYVDQARNQIVRETLAERPLPTHLLGLDDDQLWPADMLSRLLAHDKPVVGANYFRKQPPCDMVAGHFAADGYAPLKELPAGLVQVDVLGMGATLIKTEVLVAMRTRYQDEKWFCSTEVGEDVHFFRRLKEMDIPVFLDGSLVCPHIGEQLITDQHWRHFHPGAATPDAGDAVCDFADFYAQMAAWLPDNGVAVEVGSYVGRSAIVFGKALQASKKIVRFVCVDHFGKGPNYGHEGDVADWYIREVQRHGGSLRPAFAHNLKVAGLAHLVEVLECDAAVAASRFAPESVDFVFLDAEHTQNATSRAILAWKGRIKRGGILAGHDYDRPSVHKAVQSLLPEAKPASAKCWAWRKP